MKHAASLFFIPLTVQLNENKTTAAAAAAVMMIMTNAHFNFYPTETKKEKVISITNPLTQKIGVHKYFLFIGVCTSIFTFIPSTFMMVTPTFWSDKESSMK